MSDEPEVGDINPDLSASQNMQEGDPLSLQMSIRKLDMRLQQIEKKNQTIEETLRRLNEALALMREMMLAMALIEAATNPLATTSMLAIAGANFAMGTAASAIIVAETS